MNTDEDNPVPTPLTRLAPPARRRAPAFRSPLSVVALTLVAGLSHAAEPASTAPRAPAVTVANVVPGLVEARVSVSGTLVAREEVLVNPRVSGIAIERILVDVGDTVAAGDVLIELDSSTLETQLAQAEADLLRGQASIRQAQSQIDSANASATQAEAALERSERLRRSGTVAQSTLDDSTAAAASSRAALASAEDGLGIAEAQLTQLEAARRIAAQAVDRASIKAPVDGVVATRNARIGAIAAAGADPLLTLIRDAEVELEAEVVETELGGIDVGDTADVAVAGRGTLAGTVRLISPQVDPRTRLGTVRVTFEGTGSSAAPLRPGLFASGWITTAVRESLVVPASAVQTSTGGDSATVVADGTVERRAIVAGVLWGDQREVVSGLAQGELVMVKAGSFYRDGDRVRPMEAIPSAAADTFPDGTDDENIPR